MNPEQLRRMVALLAAAVFLGPSDRDQSGTLVNLSQRLERYLDTGQ